MKLSKVTKHGNPRWRVSLMENGKQVRKFFEGKAAAERFIIGRETDTAKFGASWDDTTPVERVLMIEAQRRARAGSYTLLEACDAIEAQKKAPESTMKLAELSAKFEAAKKEQGVRPKTIAVLKQTLKTFIKGREQEFAARIGSKEVSEFISRAEWSPQTRKRVLTELKGWFEWAVDNGHLMANPTRAVPVPVVEVGKTIVLTPEQAEALLRAAEKHDKGMIGYLAIALFAGLRPESEIGRLSSGSIGKEWIEVTATGKTRRRRLVAITPNLRAWLDVWLPEKEEPRPKAFAYRWLRIRKLTGWDKVKWPQDAMRHSFVSYHYALHGESETAKQAGHSVDVLHEHYRELVTKEAAERFFGIQPSTPIATA